MNRRLGRLAFLMVVVLVVLAGTVAAVPGERALVVERLDDGSELVVTPVENGTVVALAYTHSVEKSRVYDEYTVRGDRLVMTRMEFESYGWGLPAGADVTRENGTLSYDPPGSLSELTVKPGRVAGHRLIVGDRRYDLVNRSNASSVQLRIEHRSALDTAIATLT